VHALTRRDLGPDRQAPAGRRARRERSSHGADTRQLHHYSLVQGGRQRLFRKVSAMLDIDVARSGTHREECLIASISTPMRCGGCTSTSG
jgi:hypothetical protein